MRQERKIKNTVPFKPTGKSKPEEIKTEKEPVEIKENFFKKMKRKATEKKTSVLNWIKTINISNWKKQLTVGMFACITLAILCGGASMLNNAENQPEVKLQKKELSFLKDIKNIKPAAEQPTINLKEVVVTASKPAPKMAKLHVVKRLVHISTVARISHKRGGHDIAKRIKKSAGSEASLALATENEKIVEDSASVSIENNTINEPAQDQLQMQAEQLRNQNPSLYFYIWHQALTSASASMSDSNCNPE